MKQQKKYGRGWQRMICILNQKNTSERLEKVEFLKVVMRLEGIKMEEEKIKGVLDQLTPKEVKDIQKFLELTNYYQ